MKLDAVKLLLTYEETVVDAEDWVLETPLTSASLWGYNEIIEVKKIVFFRFLLLI